MSTLELAGAVTAGRCAFGLNYPDPPRGKVLLVSCEDDWESTIIPRLAALGADLTKVLRVSGVRMKADGRTMDFHLGHFRELNALLMADPEIRLVVIDPAGAYIGRAGVNENKDADLRAILGPLSESANRSGATVLLVKHLNKSAGVSAVQRVSGSVGYINAVRFAYIITPDLDDQDCKLVIPIKANVLPARGTGLAYRMVALSADDSRRLLLRQWPDLTPEELAVLSKQLFRQEWETGGVEVDPNEVTRNDHRKPKGKTAEQAADWIASLFTEEHVAYPSALIMEAGREAGYGRDSCYRAREILKDRIGLRASNVGNCRGAWHWGLGSPALWLIRDSLPSSSCQEVKEVKEVRKSGSGGDFLTS
ncbi:MAG: hypothetical protein JWO38_825 [Gemmataceae bacterium]|nr:hypothetical protein [Gemmataceae bacterium]